MKTRTYNYLLLSLIFSLGLSACSVVKSGQQAMKWKPYGKGLITEKVYKDGIVWNWPWNGMVKYNVQWQTYKENVAVLTKDELHINLTVSVTLRPIEAELPELELEVGQDYYNKVVRPEFISLTRNVFSNYKYSDVSPKSPEIEKTVFERLVEDTRAKHLEFDNVTVDHIEYPEVVTSAVNKKLAVEQDIEQKDYEMKIADKEAEIQRIRAKGQRDAQQIIDSGLTKTYLQYKALEVQDKLTGSNNAKFYFIPVGADGLPIIVNTDE
ncbi:membrane protease subunit, stomatin/prohibitin [Belliella baltica DSM 15883]|uniref:Membrane protease subunit, stomatin/prohibitin n=1 Tax=Belliella baltica (strain DSM 15883 / CIP 108006 / LMG 21964 / BA134) TaxID=866536 RepID=I3Z3U3_BELBD|nr:prohibitin family protein [Belliella baltica]AFL83911.1 membrane protease subunit, stomatin/prohibitin [Belliella baltica DSM 15883]